MEGSVGGVRPDSGHPSEYQTAAPGGRPEQDQGLEIGKLPQGHDGNLQGNQSPGGRL